MPDPTLEERIRKAAEKNGVTEAPKSTGVASKKSGLSDDKLLEAFGAEKKSPNENQTQEKQPGGEDSAKPVQQVTTPSVNPTIIQSPSEKAFSEFKTDKAFQDSQLSEHQTKLVSLVDKLNEGRGKQKEYAPEDLTTEQNPLVTGAKTVKDFVVNQVPKTIATTAAALMPDNPHLLAPEYARQPLMFNQTQEEKDKFKKGATETKKDLIDYAQQQEEESQKETGNLVKSLSDVHGFGDLMNYVAHNTANAGAQIPLAIATGGGSAIMQEAGNHYMEGVQEIAKRKGITPAEVIEKGLDQSAIAIASGALAGGLETLGAKGVAGAINKNALWGTIRDKAYKAFKSTAGEGLTEAGQSAIEQTSMNVQAGDNAIEAAKKVDPNQLLEEGVAGAVGALGLHGISSGGKAAIEKVKDLTSKKHQVEADLSKPDITPVTKEILEKEKASTDEELEKAKQEVHDEHEKVVNGTIKPEGETIKQSDDIIKDGGDIIKDEKATNDVPTEKIPPSTSPTAEPAKEVKEAAPAPEEKINEPTLENEQGKTILPTSEGEQKVSRETVKELTDKELNNKTSSEGLSEDNAKAKQITEVQSVPTTDEGSKGTRTEEEQLKKERQATKKILESDNYSEELKKGVSDEGKYYIPKSHDLNNKEADALIELKGPELAMKEAVDLTNDLHPGNRTKIVKKLISKFDNLASQAKKEGNLQQEKEYRSKALELTHFRGIRGTNIAQELSAYSEPELNKSSSQRLYEAQQAVKEQRDLILKPHEQEIRDKAKIINQLNEDIVNKLIGKEDLEKIIGTKQETALSKRKARSVKEAVDFLEGLKININNQTNDITFAVPAHIYNGAISVVQKSLQAGEAISKAISKAVAHIKQNHKEEWDEKGFKAYLEEKLKKHEAVLDSEKAVKGELKNQNTNIREVIKRHYTKAEEIKTSLTEKLTKESGLEPQEAAELAKEIQDKFNKLAETAKKNYINQKKKTVTRLTRPVSHSIDKQLLELSNTGAINDEDVRSTFANKIGLKDISEEEANRIIELGDIIQEAQNFAEKTQEEFTPENVKKYIELKKEQQKALDEIEVILADKKPKNIGDTLSTILQGNLLSPISVITNVYSNGLLMPLRFVSKGIAQGVDFGISKMFNKPQAMDLMAANKGFWQGAKVGAKQGFKELATGPGAEEIKKFDIGRGFKPVKAFLKGISKNEQQTLNERINNLTEGTLGMPAEVFFRLLNFGDKPFEAGAEMAKAYELASLKGLKGQDLEKFLLFPDEESAKQIKEAGQEQTFKGENAVSKLATTITGGVHKIAGDVPYLGPFLKVLTKSQMPFVKTPINIILETFDYALPQVSLAKSLYYTSKGERVKAEELLGKAVVGFMLQAAADALFKNGLISGGQEDDKKERTLQYQAFPAKGLNLSGLMRAINGGDPKIQQHDTFIAYDKMGVLGTVLNMRAEIGEKKMQDENKFNSMLSELMYDTFSSLPGAANSALEQSFLAGTNNLLEAITKNDYSSWLSSTTGSISSIAVPNTITTIARASREHVPEMKDSDIEKRLINVLKAKVGMTGDLPVKIDLWGQPIKQTPSGAANSYIYHLFDVTKRRDIVADKNSMEVYNLWKETGDKDVIPSAPKSTIKIDGKSFSLTPKQYEDYLRSIGAARKALMDAVIDNEQYKKMDSDGKIEILKEIYKQGYESGQDNFLNKILNIKEKLKEVKK